MLTILSSITVIQILGIAVIALFLIPNAKTDAEKQQYQQLIALLAFGVIGCISAIYVQG